MKNLTTHKNWLREEVTPPLLRRTGTRVNKLQRDWDRDFSFQTLDRDAAWVFHRNLHKKYYGKKLEKLRRTGRQVTVEVRSG